MYDLLLYSLKAGACLAVFYLYFKLLLSRETFHRLNRIVVLGAVALAFVLPLCVITIYREMPALPEIPVVGAETKTMTVEPVIERPFPWEMLLGALFLAGAAAMLLRTLWSVGCVVRVVASGRREALGEGVVLVRVPQEITPFSWGHYIVISDEDMAVSGREIVLHEREHLRLNHSLDLLLMDLAGCLQWFNPAMWLLRRELRAIHEYEADAAVLRSGVDARAYQMLLIRKAVGRRWYSVANSFNHSKLKNRITMMLCEKSSRWAGAKTLLVLPLACVALGAFARTAYVFPEDKVKQESQIIRISGSDISMQQVGGKPLVIVDGAEVKSIEEVDPARIASIRVLKDSSVLAEYGERARNGVILVTLRKPGEAQPKGEKMNDVSVVVYGDKSSGKTAGTYEIKRVKPAADNILYLVDGKAVLSADGIDASRIESITVRKDEAARKEAARKGNYSSIIEIRTKEAAGGNAAGRDELSAQGLKLAEEGIESAEKGLNESKAQIEALREHMTEAEWKKHMKQIAEAKRQIGEARLQLAEARKQVGEAGEQAKQAAQARAEAADQFRTAGRVVSIRQNGKTVSLSGAGSGNSPIFVVDGKVVEQADVNKLKTEQIASITVNKSESAPSGRSGHNGTIVITTKSGAGEKAEVVTGSGSTRVSTTSDADNSVTVYKGSVTLNEVPDAALYFINGKQATRAKVERIAAKKIRKMEVYRGAEAVNRYGEEGRGGVIVIRTRR